MRKKRLVSLVLVVILLLSCMPTASAADVHFTVINDDAPLPLISTAMPVNYNGTIYLSADTLEIVGAKCLVDKITREVRLYLLSDSTVYIHFDLDAGTAVTGSGTSLNITPLYRNNRYFFPSSVCEYLGLEYTYINISPAPIVRICDQTVNTLDHMDLVNTADSLYGLTERYNAYIGAQSNLGVSGGTSVSSGGGSGNGSGGNGGDTTGGTNPGGTTPGGTGTEGPNTTTPPGTGQTAETDNPQTGVGSQDAHYTVSVNCVGLTDEIGGLLDTLDAGGLSATFFVTQEEITANAGLIRRIYGEGHQLGIYLSGDAETAYTGAADALFETVKVRTLLVAGADDSLAGQAAQLGLVYTGALSDGQEEYTTQSLLSGLSESGRNDLLLDCSAMSSTQLNGLAQTLASGSYTVNQISELGF